ncbi:hypothetical protein TELCIR_17145 [Teladorsagia circumcincta]|uniref:Uncharacterized protein n=1 Tax=Teladorsagia circumcincta TaxID=45464 RepID=A0A2G9TTN3_TELCI|nr:hypothetical protein TELCIR_17145 [Teladorsagia circumcincta]
MEKAEEGLSDLVSALDNQGDIKDDGMAEFESYAAKTEEALAPAFDHIILLQARRQALTSQRVSGNDRSGQPSPVQGSEALSTTVISQTQTKATELPPLPVSTFAGNIWEWDNFWEIFSNNTHSKDLPEMVEYNYLLDALEGEARESIMKYRVTKNNYPKAVASLHKKYNNKEALVNHLVDRLECCALRTPSIKHQRSLLEQLQAITTQLQDKGEDVNSSWLVKKVLAKFPDSTKRKVIIKKQGLSMEMPFIMSLLFQLIDETLSSEEMFQVFAEKPHQ